ncbi:MAG: hypothetical protein FWG47_01595 [Propionibacteriaceae bacterium]|nr:hypothetical protein [Propionibacteriaceae bacterium]
MFRACPTEDQCHPSRLLLHPYTISKNDHGALHASFSVELVEGHISQKPRVKAEVRVVTLRYLVALRRLSQDRYIDPGFDTLASQLALNHRVGA